MPKFVMHLTEEQARDEEVLELLKPNERVWVYGNFDGENARAWERRGRAPLEVTGELSGYVRSFGRIRVYVDGDDGIRRELQWTGIEEIEVRTF